MGAYEKNDVMLPAMLWNMWYQFFIATIAVLWNIPKITNIMCIPNIAISEIFLWHWFPFNQPW